MFTDDQGNTYVNQRGGAGKQGSHSISGPGLTATRGQSLPPAPAGGASYNARSRRGVVVTRPDRTVLAGPGGTYVGRSRRGVVVSRPDRFVVAGPGGAYVSRQSRQAPITRHPSIGPDNVVEYELARRSALLRRSHPERTVDVDSNDRFIPQRDRRSLEPQSPDHSVDVSRQSRAAPADFQLSIGPDNVVRYGRPRRSPQIHISRPDHTVDVGSDGSFIAQSAGEGISRPDHTVDNAGSDASFVAQRDRRSPEPQFHISRPDRTVDVGSDGSFIAQRHRRSPQRVQGENFVARGNQAGTWNDEVSVWKRPDGRTVTIDKNGNAITSGSPNGRGPQYVSYRFQFYKT